MVESIPGIGIFLLPGIMLRCMQSHPKQQSHLHDCFCHRPASEECVLACTVADARALGRDGGEMEGDGFDGLEHFGCKSVQAQVGARI